MNEVAEPATPEEETLPAPDDAPDGTDTPDTPDEEESDDALAPAAPEE